MKPLDRTPELLPFRRAAQLESCLLFWLPVRAFPIPVNQRTWLLHLLHSIDELLTNDFGLRGEMFLQYKTVSSVQKAFLRKVREFQPMLGLSRRPGAPLPEMLTKERLDAVIKNGQSLSINDSVPDYSYWFLTKSPAEQREEFFGYGGTTRIFLKPDESTKPPEMPFTEAMRKSFDPSHIARLEQAVAAGYALKDPFLSKSKELFGAGLEQEPQYPGIQFILPLLSSADFFSQPKPELDKWFQLFEVYTAESPADQGVLLATRLDLEEPLIALLKSMREKFKDYPE
ncbi:MAG TPA: hypothetical protein VMB25_22315 [Bryobacteraceae bacterium]|nr:hypothetical protein [Bryobacteraceae bacterium]